MPDLMSHLLIALILAELFNIRKKSLVLLGALLPDFLSKFYILVFYFNIKDIFSFSSFSTPVMCFLVAVLIAPLFRFNRYKAVFLISIGLLSHFLSDLSIRHYTAGQQLFFPFLMRSYTLNLIWPEQSIYVLIGSLFVYAVIRVAKTERFVL